MMGRTAPDRLARLPFWVAWMVANLLGAALGAALGWLLLRLVMAGIEETGALDMLTTLVLLPVTGLGLGAGQALALRRWLPRAGWWVLATGLGWLLGLSVDFSIQVSAASAAAAPAAAAWMGFFLAGLYQAALQWLLLRRSGWRSLTWLPLSAAAWAASGIVYGLLSQIPGPEPLALALKWSAAGAIFALLTGFILPHYTVARPQSRVQ